MKKYHPLLQKNYGKRQIKSYCGRSKQAKMYQKHQNKYSLSGKIYCAKHQCGYVRKIRHYANKEDVVFWYCADFHKTGKKNCMPAYFKEDDLYDIFLSIFKDYDKYKDEVLNELLSLYKKFSMIDGDNEKIKLQNEISILTKKKERVLDLALDGILSKEELYIKKLAIDEQISKIRANLSKLEGKEKKVDYEKSNMNILKHLVITMDNIDSYIEELLDKVIVVEEDGKIKLRVIFEGGTEEQIII